MPQLTLLLLGPLLVTLDDREIAGFAYDKVRALLIYLALEADRPQRRAALAELLWPDQPAGVARSSLRRALATLRQAIGDATADPPFLLITRDTIQFNRAGDHRLDVAEFSRLLAACDAHAHPAGELCPSCAAWLEQAAQLYRGDFLAQFGLRGCAAFAEWALLIRERLHRRALAALARLMAHHEGRHAGDLAREYAWQILALEPWDEPAHRCLMRVLVHKGQRWAALAQYERCRAVLADELGIAPSDQTVALYEEIRTGALERAVGMPSALGALAASGLLSPGPPAPAGDAIGAPRSPDSAMAGSKPRLPWNGLDPQSFDAPTSALAEAAQAIALSNGSSADDRSRDGPPAKGGSFRINRVLEQSLEDFWPGRLLSLARRRYDMLTGISIGLAYAIAALSLLGLSDAPDINSEQGLAVRQAYGVIAGLIGGLLLGLTYAGRRLSAMFDHARWRPVHLRIYLGLGIGLVGGAAAGLIFGPTYNRLVATLFIASYCGLLNGQAFGFAIRLLDYFADIDGA